MRVGIFGGSFSPVHEGHLALAKEALSELNLDRVIFVPSFEPPLRKKASLWPAKTRLKLLNKAIRNFPSFSVSLCEMERKGRSFTVDTLKHFRKKLGKEAVLYFLAGADTLKTLPRWKSVEQIFKLSRFVVTSRPGFALQKSVPWPVIFLPFEALPVSSTSLRRSSSTVI